MNDIEILLRELGRVRQDVGRRALRRRQVNEVLKFVGYVAFTVGAVYVLLSL